MKPRDWFLRLGLNLHIRNDTKTEFNIITARVMFRTDEK